ncbi:MAG: hypothetical protein H0T99_05245 [Geodermatophilaceae bacterium]|nr:hypothetical protein [Geodermatophilaceae bacterium]
MSSVAGPSGPAIVAEGLTKIYKSRSGEVRALDGLDLEVEEGTVLALLGPNGAAGSGCPASTPPWTRT